ncbi:MAG: hypothetical protein ACLFNL_07680 [Bacteroidales bacterium]
MGLKFFHIPRAREYGYKPIFYDERKEELERRKRAIDQEQAMEERMGKEAYIANIKGQMRGYMRMARKERKKYNIRVAVILAILFFLAYLLLS